MSDIRESSMGSMAKCNQNRAWVDYQTGRNLGAARHQWPTRVLSTYAPGAR